MAAWHHWYQAAIFADHSDADATIASAIAGGDSDLAATATHVHLANSLAYMLRLSDGQVAGQRITV